MTIHRIGLLGDPVLRTRCEPVSDPRSMAARVVADDLRETLQDLRTRHGMGRGIAAPQIGAPLRMVYLDVDGPLLMINPEVADVGREDFVVWDDCFSFPDLLVRVQRAYHVSVRYLDAHGREQEVTASGPFAELLQHEIDHLDGVLAVDRAVGLDPLCYRQEWNLHHADDGRYGSPAPRSIPRQDQVVF